MQHRNNLFAALRLFAFGSILRRSGPGASKMRAATVGQAIGGRRRRGSLLASGPLAIALCLHLTLLLLILAWKPPPIDRAASVVEISLLSGLGAAPYAKPVLDHPQPSPDPPQISPAPNRAMADAAPAPDLSSVLKPKPPLVAPDSVIKIATALALKGAIPTVEPLPVTPTSATTAVAALQTAGGKSCRIADILQQTLQTSAGAQAAVALIPASSRSVANAVLLWDGRWLDAPSLGGSAVLQTLQQAVTEAVNAAPPDCRNEIVHGPQLIILGDAKRTMVLAFGSGTWRWSDMAATVTP
jgi:hypothetical protein